MTHAYDKCYLDDAKTALGGAVEYAVVQCAMGGQEFFRLFLLSGIARQFEEGNVVYLAGLSGVELVRLIFTRCGIEVQDTLDLSYVNYPPEYWVGWILAHYQWHCNRPFKAILSFAPYDVLESLYGPCHEAEVEKTFAILDRLAKEESTPLARLRREQGLSQSQLARASEIVSLRSIQLYEQRRTDIHRAQHNHLLALSRALHCRVEDLLA